MPSTVPGWVPGGTASDASPSGARRRGHRGPGRPAGPRRARWRPPRPGTAEPPEGAGPRAVTWEEAERLVTASLLTGLIEPAEYRESLALLAEAEYARSPLHLPQL
ncbi:hypothetical protein PUR71_27835 [Streptomyces sp. SP17BM10]|uniref:hypothetical protein n=1 Tax=Streptomyces sp. SP17BM10 TaxID=3002530 RepID=UPI002E761E58|nr:hypothetical protein [Streptomyces sp. SP17BM10]MEE1786683.1 hypothetical protein [Streptomyces sp. SP17BM10]